MFFWSPASACSALAFAQQWASPCSVPCPSPALWRKPGAFQRGRCRSSDPRGFNELTVFFQQLAEPFDLLLHRLEHPLGVGGCLRFGTRLFIFVKPAEPEMSLRFSCEAPELLLAIAGLLIPLNLVRRGNSTLLSLDN